ncbi:class I SAM-dependent methyltransferase [Kordiimonas marina]|uniref:class I SAM-dependent methyltransferase n=1 Tax=Kordiimonas marina TaxID=2872312 RepID=UPI001FF4AA60|nr:class I SAM-dependent methyltransferase [Kordiimonas marina]MCJ9429983.1 class I SAM-dependent methyltransferase [Kordiimonas marina]
MEEYVAFKNWDLAFKPTELESELYEGDFRDITIKGKAVLDIGFGNGGFMGWAKEKGATVSGIEVISDAVHGGKDFGFDTYLYPGFDTDAFEGHFDLIVALDLFEHLTIQQINDYLGLIEKCLKPNGQVVLRFPNGQSPFGRIYQYADVTHISVLSAKIMEQLLGPTNLTITSVREPYFAIQWNKGFLFGLAKSMQKAGRSLMFFLLKKLVGLGDYTMDINVVLILRKKA